MRSVENTLETVCLAVVCVYMYVCYIWYDSEDVRDGITVCSWIVTNSANSQF